jgi:DNA-binding Lrp family transcriptional regulator
MDKRELSQNINTVFNDFRGEDWVLYVIYLKKHAIPKEIIEECQKFKSEDASRPISLKRSWYFDRLTELENRELIKSIPIQTNPEHKRRYNGYEITFKGKKFIQQKLKTDLIEKVSVYNQLAQQELDEFTEIVAEILLELKDTRSDYYELFDDILILLSAINIENLEEFYLKSLPTEYDRKFLICAVCTFMVIHSHQYIESFIPEYQTQDLKEKDWLSLQRYCKNWDIKETLTNLIIEEILTETNSFQLIIHQKATDQTFFRLTHNENTNLKEKQGPGIVVYFFHNTPSWAYCEKAIQNQINKYFLKISLKEALFQKDRLIDDIFFTIVKSNIIGPSFTGLSNRNINDSYSSPNQITYQNGDQQLRFKQLILEVIKMQLTQRKELNRIGLLETPITALELMDKIQINELTEKFPDDRNVQYLKARELLQTHRYRQALDILKSVFDKSLDQAESEIFWDIMDCYQALNQYAEIPKFFEYYWQNSNPTFEEFDFYFRTLIDLGKFKEVEKRIEEYLINVLPEYAWERIEDEIKKSNRCNFFEWMFLDYNSFVYILDSHILDKIFNILLYMRFIQGDYEYLVGKCKDREDLRFENLPLYLESLNQLNQIDQIKQILPNSPLSINRSWRENEIFACKLRILARYYKSDKIWVDDMIKNMGLWLFNELLEIKEFIQEIEKYLHNNKAEISITYGIGVLKNELTTNNSGYQSLASKYLFLKDLPLPFQERKRFEILTTQIKKKQII